MASASTSEHATFMQKEAPCGCIMQVGAGEAMGTTTTTTTSGKCPCECCGEGCRCIEVKGKCDCAEKMQAALGETSGGAAAEGVHHAAATPAMVTTTTVSAPMGCVVEAGNEEVCPTCGGKGCKCIAIKGRCDCLEVK